MRTRAEVLARANKLLEKYAAERAQYPVGSDKFWDACIKIKKVNEVIELTKYSPRQ